MDYFSYDQIASAVILFLALAASFVLIGNVIELIRKWVTTHNEKKSEVLNKVDYLKNQNSRHNSSYQDVVNLKKQVGSIQESVEKIDAALEQFIKQHEIEMRDLNEETALQTGAIKCLLDNAIKTANDSAYQEVLMKERQKFDEFLIHRGR